MTIRLEEIRLHAYHGCLPQEARVGNDYVVDVEVALPDTDAALERDELEGTINYAELYAVVREEMSRPSRLLEHVAARIAKHIRRDYPSVEAAKVTVSKLAPPIAGAALKAASVTIDL